MYFSTRITWNLEITQITWNPEISCLHSAKDQSFKNAFSSYAQKYLLYGLNILSIIKFFQQSILHFYLHMYGLCPF